MCQASLAADWPFCRLATHSYVQGTEISHINTSKRHFSKKLCNGMLIYCVIQIGVSRESEYLVFGYRKETLGFKFWFRFLITPFPLLLKLKNRMAWPWHSWTGSRRRGLGVGGSWAKTKQIKCNYLNPIIGNLLCVTTYSKLNLGGWFLVYNLNITPTSY